jgi:hypothetical protein
MKKRPYIPIVEARLVNADGDTAPFRLTFYGLPLDVFLTGDGGHRIRAALERRGITGYVSSPFMVFERRLSL